VAISTVMRGLWVLLGRAEEDRRSGPEPLGSGVPRISTWTRPGCIGALPRARLARRGAPGARRLNPKTSFVVRITTGPVGLAWRLPLSHWVGGALEPLTPGSISTWNTRSSICDHGGISKGVGLDNSSDTMFCASEEVVLVKVFKEYAKRCCWFVL
jgi:hypothetical protein